MDGLRARLFRRRRGLDAVSGGGLPLARPQLGQLPTAGSPSMIIGALFGGLSGAGNATSTWRIM